MFWAVIHIIDIALWCFVALSVGYITFYAIAYAVGSFKTRGTNSRMDDRRNSFLVIFPAYSEDSVILHSITEFTRQAYPTDKYSVVVVSDHMKAETNQQLSSLPITLLQPVFDKSSKAKALQYAIDNIHHTYDYVIILDADNIVRPDFLCRLNALCDSGFTAIQCHRRAKNSDSKIAELDGISEEINNSLFRKGHNNIGLSSALIGSGMCFDYQWFASHVHRLSTAGEDRELEKMLLSERIYIKYADDIEVLDEKVGNEGNFQRQRQRWMSAQIHSLLSLTRDLPTAIMHFNINYIDKTLQQMLIPRSMLLVGTFLWSVVMTAVVPVWAAKWWMLFALTVLAMFTAIPRKMRSHSLVKLITHLPRLTFKMLANLRHIDSKNREFIHTTHE